MLLGARVEMLEVFVISSNFCPSSSAILLMPKSYLTIGAVGHWPIHGVTLICIQSEEKSVSDGLQLGPPLPKSGRALE